MPDSNNNYHYAWDPALKQCRLYSGPRPRRGHKPCRGKRKRRPRPGPACRATPPIWCNQPNRTPPKRNGFGCWSCPKKRKQRKPRRPPKGPNDKRRFAPPGWEWDPKKPPRRMRREGHRAVSPRTRVRTDIVDSTFTVTHSLSTFPQYVQTVNIKSGTRYEIMTDTIGLKRHWYNPVSHEKVQWRPFKVGHVYQGNQVALFMKDITISFVDEVLSDLPRPPADVLDDLAVLAEDHAKSAVDAKSSLINFLTELIAAFGGSIAAIWKASNLWTTALKAFQKEYARLQAKGFSHPSSWWLAWNFAIKPTIKDLSDSLQAVSRTIKRLEWLRVHNGVPTFVKFGRPDFWHPPEDNGTIIDWFPDYKVGSSALAVSDSWLRLRRDTYKVDFNSTHCVLFTIPPGILNGSFAGMHVWLKITGISNPAAVFWEAMPFSWLIDWFMRERTKLQAKLLDVQQWNLPDASILANGHSVKVVATYILEQTFDGGMTYSPLTMIVARRFIRRPGMPDVLSDPFTVPLEWYNLSILIALAHQWWTKRK